MSVRRGKEKKNQDDAAASATATGKKQKKGANNAASASTTEKTKSKSRASESTPTDEGGGVNKSPFGDWTGNSPISLLYEYIQRKHWATKPRFEQLPCRKSGEYMFRVVVEVPPDPKRKSQLETVICVPPRSSPSVQEARHAAAVAALHKIAHDRPMNRLLAPTFRDLWREMDELAEQERLRAEEDARRQKHAEEQRQRAEKRKAEEERNIAEILMTKEARTMIEDVLKLADEQDALASNAPDSTENDMATTIPDDRAEAIAEKLEVIGFPRDYIDRALAEVKVATDLIDDDMLDASIAEQRELDSVINWLCLHVPESQLPAGYAASDALEVVSRRTRPVQSTAASASDTAPVQSGIAEAQTENVNISPHEKVAVRRFTEFGFTEADAVEALRSVNGNESNALKWLFYRMVSRVAETPPMHSEIDQSSAWDAQNEEMIAVEAIVGPDKFHRTSSRSFYVDVVDSDVSELQENDECYRLEVAYPEGCLYPLANGVLPVMLVRHPRACTADTMSTSGDIFRRKVAARNAALIEWALRRQLTSPSVVVYEALLWLRTLPDSFGESPVVVSALPNATKPPQGVETPHRAPPWSTRRQTRPSTTATSTSKDRISAELLRRHRALLDRTDLRPLLAQRAALPAASLKSSIVSAVASNAVVVVVGDTGSGKSTQIPQFLLDDAIERGCGAECRVVVTQPRRLPTVTIAERVAAERGEDVGATVGYQIRLEARRSRRTRILYVTTGVMLKMLAGECAIDKAEADDNNEDSISHIVIDEVHERSVETDILLALMKDWVVATATSTAAGAARRRPAPKLILMSATVDAQRFISYFVSAGVMCATVSIPGRTFPVTDMFLEDLLAVPEIAAAAAASKRFRENSQKGLTKEQREEVRQKEDEERRLLATEWPTLTPEAIDVLWRTRSHDVDVIDKHFHLNFDLLAAIVRYAASNRAMIYGASVKSGNSKGAILVFLPGMPEIVQLQARLQPFRENLHIVPLHADLPANTQRAVFMPAPNGAVKVVLSTNVAETSVTIDDVAVVVDSGRMNEAAFDHDAAMETLAEVPIARANGRQRRGRAGRTRSGWCLHAYTKAAFERLPEQRPPEIARVPLERLCLEIMLVLTGGKVRPTESTVATAAKIDIGAFLNKTIEPPDVVAVRRAVDILVEAGAAVAMETPIGSVQARLTPLGCHLARLPVDVHIGKMLIFGCILRCIDPVLTIAAVAAAGKSPFERPLERRQEADAAHSAFGYAKSDHLTLVKAFNSWRAAKNKRRFCEENFISYARMETISEMRRQLTGLLEDMGFLSHGGAAGEAENVYAANVKVIKAALVAGLYPKLISIVFPETTYHKILPGVIANPTQPRELKMYTKTRERVFVHPSSINFSQGEYESPWLLYGTLARPKSAEAGKVYIKETTMVAPYALLLFAGNDVRVEPQKGQVVIDDWVRFRAPARIAVLVNAIRRRLDVLLLRRFKHPEFDVSTETKLVDAVAKLLTTEGAI